QVEVFRLDFRSTSRDAGLVVSSTVKRASCDVGTEEAALAEAGETKKRRCVDSSSILSSGDAAVQACEAPAPSSTAAAAAAAAEVPAASEPSISKTSEVKEAARHINTLPAPEPQPAPALRFSYLPHSTVHLMPLGQFLSTCRGTHARRSAQTSAEQSKSSESPLPAWQLLYLAWRGLPQSSAFIQSDIDFSLTEKSQCPDEQLSSGSTPHGFRTFIDQLLVPTLSPPFLEALRQQEAQCNKIKEAADKGSQARARGSGVTGCLAGGREQWNLWVGRSATSQIHFDGMDNVHVCLQGSKIIHLYSPSDSIFLYPMPWSEDRINNKSSLPSILTACPEKYPLVFSQATCYRVQVRASIALPYLNFNRIVLCTKSTLLPVVGAYVQLMQGEAIFIPAGWWHEVFTFGPMTVSANVWFPPHPSCHLRPTLMMLHS
ncbi:unnamed protein product, partial [Closterium sp. Naga37s-1]